MSIKITKAKAQKVHFKKRLLQRYGMTTNRIGLKEIVNKIQAGEARFVEKQSNRVSVFDVYFEGKYVRVVYDKNRKTVVTALPI